MKSVVYKVFLMLERVHIDPVIFGRPSTTEECYDPNIKGEPVSYGRTVIIHTQSATEEL